MSSTLRHALRTLLACVLSIGAFGLMAGPAHAATHVVNDDTFGAGPAGADCSTPDHSTLQDAVDAAAPDDEILVCAGVYDDPVLVDKAGLVFRGAKSGIDGRTRALNALNESVIEDEGVRVVANDITFNGFFVRNAGQDPVVGAGIKLDSGTGDHRIQNNIIQSNVVGLYLTNETTGDTIVTQNRFDKNNDTGPAAGNGIYGDFGVNGATIADNLFLNQDNSAILITETAGRNSDIDIVNNEIRNSRGMLVHLTDGLRIHDNSLIETESGDGNGRFSGIFLGGGNNGVSVRRNHVEKSFTALRIANNVGEPNSDVVVIGNSFVHNDAYGIHAGANTLSGDLVGSFNRIFSNNDGGARNDDSGEGFELENNWWGCNESPAVASNDCDDVTGFNVDVTPRLIMRFSVPNPVRVGSTVPATATFRVNSFGQDTPGIPDGSVVRFAATRGTIDRFVPTDNGRATARYRATNPGVATLISVLDAERITRTTRNVS